MSYSSFFSDTWESDLSFEGQIQNIRLCLEMPIIPVAEHLKAISKYSHWQDSYFVSEILCTAITVTKYVLRTNLHKWNPSNLLKLVPPIREMQGYVRLAKPHIRFPVSHHNIKSANRISTSKHGCWWITTQSQTKAVISLISLTLDSE